MQRGMHRTFVFPIDCFSPQTPISDLEVKETKYGVFIKEREVALNNTYDVFDKPEIIPSLINLVEKMNRGSDHYWPEDTKNINLIMKWIKQWGFLTGSKSRFISLLPEDFYGERVSDFLEEAAKLYHLWNLYKAVANRDLDFLSQIDIYKGDLHKDIEDEVNFLDEPYTFHFFPDKFYSGTIIAEYNTKKPLKSLQQASMLYLVGKIEENINEHTLNWKEIKYNPIGDEDRYQITPQMCFPTLLNALYMQFFILLNENTKKICPVCNIPFVPERRDKIYCSDSCKSTAKSRRYRAKNIN